MWGAPVVAAAQAISAVLGLLAMMWAVFEIVFGPGRITAHRVRGAIALYLAIAILFAWFYRLLAEVVPDRRFPALKARRGPAWRVEPISLLQPHIADDSRTGRHHAG